MRRSFISCRGKINTIESLETLSVYSFMFKAFLLIFPEEFLDFCSIEKKNEMQIKKNDENLKSCSSFVGCGILIY